MTPVSPPKNPIADASIRKMRRMSLRCRRSPHDTDFAGPLENHMTIVFTSERRHGERD
jgi:hypothetical protein